MFDTAASNLIAVIIVIIIIVIIYGVVSKEGLAIIPDVSNRLYGVIPLSATSGISIPRSRAF